MIYTPKRKEKRDYSLSFNNNSELKLQKEKKKILQNEFRNKYLEEDSALIKALEKISLSQINRFYSLLENSTSLSEEDIKIFVKKQLDRAIVTNDDDLKSAKDFYEYYQEHFLELENNITNKSNFEHLIALEMIKDYIRFYTGVKSIKESLKRTDEKKGDN